MSLVKSNKENDGIVYGFYSERAWLDITSHSGASIHCYFNPECINDEQRCFVRITDCQTSVRLNIWQTELESVKRFIRTLKDIRFFISSVADNDIPSQITLDKNPDLDTSKLKSYTNGIEIIYEKFERPAAVTDSARTQRRLFIKRGYENILLHSDKYTCNPLEWELKLKRLAFELNSFIIFLTEQVKITSPYFKTESTIYCYHVEEVPTDRLSMDEAQLSTQNYRPNEILFVGPDKCQWFPAHLPSSEQRFKVLTIQLKYTDTSVYTCKTAKEYFSLWERINERNIPSEKLIELSNSGYQMFVKPEDHELSEAFIFRAEGNVTIVRHLDSMVV